MSQDAAIAPTATGLPIPGPTKARRRRAPWLRVTRSVRRRPRPAPYRPRRADGQPFDRASGEWRRMMLSLQRLA